MRLKLFGIPILKYAEIIYFVILFGWISLFPEPIQAQYATLARMSLVLLLIILVITEKKKLKSIFNLKDWPLWVFLIFLSSGIFGAKNKDISITSYRYLCLTLLLFFYIGKILYLEEKERARIGLVICIASIIISVIGLLELYFGRNILYERFITNPFYARYIKISARPMSTQLNPAVLGSYLLGCLAFSFYFFRSKSKGLRLLGIATTFLCSSIIFLTFSRGVFLGFMAMTLFYLWKIKKRKAVMIMFLSFALVISIASFQNGPLFSRFGFKRFFIGNPDSIISQYRLDRVKMTAKILKEHPFVGIGFNHFRIRFNEYCEEKEPLAEFRIPDNMYLTFLAETGIIGTLGFLIFIILLLKKGLYILHKLKEGAHKQMLIICLASLLGLLVNMGGYDLFYWNNPYMIFCLLCGFIAALTLEPTEIKQ